MLRVFFGLFSREVRKFFLVCFHHFFAQSAKISFGDLKSVEFLTLEHKTQAFECKALKILKWTFVRYRRVNLFSLASPNSAIKASTLHSLLGSCDTFLVSHATLTVTLHWKCFLAFIVKFLATFALQMHREYIQKDGNGENQPKPAKTSLNQPRWFTPLLGKIRLVSTTLIQPPVHPPPNFWPVCTYACKYQHLQSSEAQAQSHGMPGRRY